MTLRGWEGDRRSDVALAMCHRVCGLSTYGLKAFGHGQPLPVPFYYPEVVGEGRHMCCAKCSRYFRYRFSPS